MLSEDVIRRLVSSTDQRTRVACCLASKRLRGVVTKPDVWRDVTVYDPGDAAARFVHETRAETVRVVCSDVHRVEAFFDELARLGAGFVRAVRVELGHAACSRDGWALLMVLSEFEGLETLDICVEGMESPACLGFPGVEFHKLRDVCIRDASRKLEVYFRGVCLPCLERVTLEVRTSDVLAQARRFHGLHTVHYDGERETYEDANLGGIKLGTLAVRVGCWMSASYLMSAAARAAHIEVLKLTSVEDVVIDTYLPISALYVTVMTPHADVECVHSVVRGLKTVAVTSDGGPFTVRFLGTGSWTNFMRWLTLAHFDVGLRGRVVVDT